MRNLRCETEYRIETEMWESVFLWERDDGGAVRWACTTVGCLLDMSPQELDFRLNELYHSIMRHW